MKKNLIFCNRSTNLHNSKNAVQEIGLTLPCFKNLLLNKFKWKYPELGQKQV